FDEATGPTQVQIAVLAGHEQDLAQAVPNLVRKLFEIPEPAPPSAHVAAPPAPPPDASSTSAAPASAPSDGGGSISALTWLTLVAGVATVGTGVALGISANSDYDRFKSMRVQTRAQAENASRKFSSIETRGTLANVL